MEIYYTYILQNPGKKFYIGQTNNLNKRLSRHNNNIVKSTNNRGPWTVVHSEIFPSRAEAMKREKQLKHWRRELIINLITSKM
ncbi:MAG: GIY-YIG nuclease family protein [Bacteroidetes bacterium]|jgi:putative endonuclease|nr:GIY-YIG nuclease family protein [Bacteroidota bacterium]